MIPIVSLWWGSRVTLKIFSNFSSSCSSPPPTSPHKTLRFYYVNVYRTICFFLILLRSTQLRLLISRWWWWIIDGVFFSSPLRFLLHFSCIFFYPQIHFLLLLRCCRAIWDICLRRCNEIVTFSLLDYDVSNYEFAKHQMDLWFWDECRLSGQMMLN